MKTALQQYLSESIQFHARFCTAPRSVVNSRSAVQVTNENRRTARHRAVFSNALSLVHSIRTELQFVNFSVNWNTYVLTIRGKNGNGKRKTDGEIKIFKKKRQQENWATGKIGNKNKGVEKQGNTKLMYEITATEKTATGQMGNGKLGSGKIQFGVALFSYPLLIFRCRFFRLPISGCCFSRCRFFSCN